jgi:hypothetical protein
VKDRVEGSMRLSCHVFILKLSTFHSLLSTLLGPLIALFLQSSNSSSPTQSLYSIHSSLSLLSLHLSTVNKKYCFLSSSTFISYSILPSFNLLLLLLHHSFSATPYTQSLYYGWFISTGAIQCAMRCTEKQIKKRKSVGNIEGRKT